MSQRLPAAGNPAQMPEPVVPPLGPSTLSPQTSADLRRQTALSAAGRCRSPDHTRRDDAAWRPDGPDRTRSDNPMMKRRL